MANRRMGGGGGGGGSNFDGSFSRRPVAGGGGGGNFQNQGPGQYGSPFGQQTQSRQANFDQSYSRRDKGGSDFYGDGGRGNYGNQGNQSVGRSSFGSGGGGGGGGGGRDGYGHGDDFGSRGNSQQFQQSRVVRDREDLQPFNNSGVGNVGWRQRSPSPRGVGGGGSSTGKMFGGMNRDGNWSRNQNQGFDDNQQGGMRSGGANPGQQVVMVVPQGNTGTGGLMGMVPVQAQNPFNMTQRQQPMQVIVGNLPAFNADLGQQILAAASARPQFGQGMMGGPQMGLVNQQNMQRGQQQQQFNRYDRSVAEGGQGSRSNDSGRFSRQSSSQQRSSGRSAVARRSDPPSRSSAPGRGIGSNSSAATLRGNRKRAVLRDRHGATDEIERKRARTSLPIRAGNRGAGPNKGKQGNQKGTNKKKGGVGGDGKKNEAKKAGDGKKDSEAKKDKEKEEKEVKAEGDEAEVKKEADGEDKDAEGETVDGEKKKSKYDEFATSLFVCKVCQKVMSDGASFESHLNGRAHVALVKILEERFQKRAELLMFESKLSEEEIGIERERQRRAGKSGHTGKGSKNFCKMCDCNYTVNWGTHKVSMGHRLLKEYLHPTCRFCTTNFVHRMDWVNHLYSVSHLKKLTELKEQGVDLEEQESSTQEELFTVTVDVGKDEKATNLFLIRPSDYSIPLKEDLKDMLKDEKGELALPEGEIEFPKEYDENVKYGEEAIMRTEGACCKVCRVYISNVNDIETHVKSKPHYGMFVSYLKKIVKYRENLKAAEEKAAKEAAELAEKEKKKAEEEAAAAAAKEKEEKEKPVKVEEDASSSAPEDKTEKGPASEEKNAEEKNEKQPEEKSSEAPMEVEESVKDADAVAETSDKVVEEETVEAEEKPEGNAEGDVEMADAQVEPQVEKAVVDEIKTESVKTEAKPAEAPAVATEEAKEDKKPAAAAASPVKPAAASPAKPATASPAAATTPTTKPAAAAAPAKPSPAAQQNRGSGNQQQRGRGAARGNNRGSPAARGGGGGSVARGRGGPQTPQGGRGGGATPSRGGGGGGGGGNMRGGRTPGRGGADSGWRGGRGGRGGGGRGSFQR